jgi:hypothetical protein
MRIAEAFMSAVFYLSFLLFAKGTVGSVNELVRKVYRVSAVLCLP